jgi:acylglycerol lipase
MINETFKIQVDENVFLKAIIKENGSPFWIVVTHGLGEHKERHQYFLKNFSQYFNICLYDLRGHGESDGPRGNIDTFETFAQDLGKVVHFLKNQYALKRYILFGHSMGGLVTADFMQNFVSNDLYPEKVFLSAPAVAAPGVMGDVFSYVPHSLTNFLAHFKPSVPLAGVLNLKKLSHDSRIYEAYVHDHLNILKVHSHLFLGVVNRGKDVFSRPLRVDCPLYVAQGTQDELVSSKLVIQYFKNIEKNASLFINEGAYHEMHNEIERYRVPYMEFLTKSLMSTIYSTT